MSAIKKAFFLDFEIKEVYRKKNVHEDVIQKIIEIVNHKGFNELATISLDGYFKVWDWLIINSDAS